MPKSNIYRVRVIVEHSKAEDIDEGLEYRVVEPWCEHLPENPEHVLSISLDEEGSKDLVEELCEYINSDEVSRHEANMELPEPPEQVEVA